jgi:hypothetical protein
MFDATKSLKKHRKPSKKVKKMVKTHPWPNIHTSRCVCYMKKMDIHTFLVSTICDFLAKILYILVTHLYRGSPGSCCLGLGDEGDTENTTGGEYIGILRSLM